MVLLSTIVLAITQLILNSSSARPRHLKRGLGREFNPPYVIA